MKILTSLLIMLLVLLTVTFQLTDYSNKELKVVFRYDDYSKYSSLALESELFEMVSSKGGGLIVGVIPYPYEPHPEIAADFDKPVFLNSEKLDLLKQYHKNDTIEIATHGFDHKNNEILDYRSEFAGLPELEQQHLLNLARQQLTSALGIEITAFVPPFNNLDRNTLTALKNSGYTLLSAAGSNPLYQAGDIDYLPGGPYPNRLRSVIDAAVANNHYDALIISTQHPYDIKESGEEMPAFRKNKVQVSIADIASDLDYISKIDNIRFTSPAKMFNNKENLSAERLISNMQLWDSLVTQHKLLPSPLNIYPIYGLYYSLEAANDMYFKQIIIASSLFLIILLLTLISSKLLLSLFYKSIWLPRVITLFALLLMGAGLAKAYLSGFYFLTAFVTTVAIGLALSACFRCKNKVV